MTLDPLRLFSLFIGRLEPLLLDPDYFFLPKFFDFASFFAFGSCTCKID